MTRLSILGLLASFVIPATIAHAEDVYWYCSANDSSSIGKPHKITAYYSDVFAADKLYANKLTLAWSDYLVRLYDNITGQCFSTYLKDNTKAKARSDRDGDATRVRRLGWEVVFTEWTY